MMDISNRTREYVNTVQIQMKKYAGGAPHQWATKSELSHLLEALRKANKEKAEYVFNAAVTDFEDNQIAKNIFYGPPARRFFTA